MGKAFHCGVVSLFVLPFFSFGQNGQSAAQIASQQPQNPLRFARRVDYFTDKRPQAILATDLNHDGHLDLVTGNNAATNISVLLGNGNGTFRNATHYPTSHQPSSMTPGDFNGDRNIDLVIASF